MMRDQWYGDNRDLVKWSALVHLARREAVSAILHVAMYRPGPAPAPLATAHGKVDPPAEVFRHFRDLDDIQRLAVVTGLEIEVVKEPFTDRAAYFGRVCERVTARRGGPMLVLLDPDVGLASETPGPEHVASAEVAAVFAALRQGDLLVCYQHARKQKDWRGRARRAFANAPGVPSFEVEVLQSEVARDVLLLAVKKNADSCENREQKE
ncbi:MAG: hypothetical protein IH939_17365 [Acidobacteria bacterium]|nr:hypothetical protein [Acidobacteriota bacterium]